MKGAKRVNKSPNRKTNPDTGTVPEPFEEGSALALFGKVKSDAELRGEGREGALPSRHRTQDKGSP